MRQEYAEVVDVVTQSGPKNRPAATSHSPSRSHPAQQHTYSSDSAAIQQLEQRINPILSKMNMVIDKFDDKVSGPQVSDKLLRFYADELSRLMIEEILEDTVHSL